MKFTGCGATVQWVVEADVGKVQELIVSQSIRAATAADLPAMEALLPRLADFDVPVHRVPEHLWHGDRDLIRQWASGDRVDVDVVVALLEGAVVGVAAISASAEWLSGEPSVHLEMLALHTCAEGLGIGSALMREVEVLAAKRGAKSLSLHVFTANARARALYERHGYDGELMRYFKRLDKG